MAKTKIYRETITDGKWVRCNFDENTGCVDGIVIEVNYDKGAYWRARIYFPALRDHRVLTLELHQIVAVGPHVTCPKF